VCCVVLPSSIMSRDCPVIDWTSEFELRVNFHNSDWVSFVREMIDILSNLEVIAFITFFLTKKLSLQSLGIPLIQTIILSVDVLECIEADLVVTD